MPIANIVMPYLTMRELWKGSDSDAESTGWRLVRAPLLLPVWWVSFLAWWVLVFAAGSPPARGVLLARDLVSVSSAGLAVVLVRRIARRERAQLVRRGDRVPSAPTWTTA